MPATSSTFSPPNAFDLLDSNTVGTAVQLELCSKPPADARVDFRGFPISDDPAASGCLVRCEFWCKHLSNPHLGQWYRHTKVAGMQQGLMLEEKSLRAATPASHSVHFRGPWTIS